MTTPEPEWLPAARLAELDREVATWQGARRRQRRREPVRELTPAEQAVRRYQEAVESL